MSPGTYVALTLFAAALVLFFVAWPSKHLRSLPRAQRREVREAVREGRAPAHPALAPAVVAEAASVEGVETSPWLRLAFIAGLVTNAAEAVTGLVSGDARDALVNLAVSGVFAYWLLPSRRSKRIEAARAAARAAGVSPAAPPTDQGA